MLFAAGLGTRLKPFTNHHPKALALVNGKSLLERNIEYLKSYGIEEIVINIHHFGNQIVEFINQQDQFGIRILISDESDEVLETGGGLVKAKNLLGDERFLVMNVDILTDLNLHEFMNFHQANHPLISLAVSKRESSRKLLFDQKIVLKGWKNLATSEEILLSQDDYEEFAFSGLHIIEPTIFDWLPKSGKFSIMKSYMDLMHHQRILGFDHSGGKLVDVGRVESVREAEKLFD